MDLENLKFKLLREASLIVSDATQPRLLLMEFLIALDGACICDAFLRLSTLSRTRLVNERRESRSDERKDEVIVGIKERTEEFDLVV